MSSEETPDTSGNDSSSDSLNSEFKKAMDSYEEFFDEYIAFMEEYENSDDVFSLLSDYLDFMSRYTETMEALESMDTGNMSPAELEYYNKVMARISQKLLKAAS